jgi:2-methylisocitrate lyase-like PEP mutase family enzyme
MEEALRRGKAYAACGADVVFVESPESVEEMKLINREINALTLCNQVEGGRTPLLPAHELEKIGYNVVIFPNALTRMFVSAGQRLLEHLKEKGTTRTLMNEMMDHHTLFSTFGYYDAEALEKKYSST